jgi:hypothetical protein
MVKQRVLFASATITLKDPIFSLAFELDSEIDTASNIGGMSLLPFGSIILLKTTSKKYHATCSLSWGVDILQSKSSK